jgi:hypothetical protein
VEGAGAGNAALTFSTFTEQGTLKLGSEEFAVRKHGAFSGRWTLEREGGIYAEARKSMLRQFEINSQGATFRVQARWFSRTFEILSDQDVIGMIRRAHPFTRRATIDCNSSFPELLQLFSFWLVAIVWRRAAKNDTAPHPGG